MSTTAPTRTRLVITQKVRDLVRTTAALGALAAIGVVGAGACYAGLLAFYLVGSAIIGR
jgi:hypothetical protein